MISKYLPLSLLVLSSTASAMKFSAQMNHLKLPVVLSTELPPQLKYVPPGNIAVTGKRMCGDRDVEHFEQAHPEFEFMPQTTDKMDVFIGYWIIKESATDITPTLSNWYPIAYEKVKIAENDAGLEQLKTFKPISHANLPTPTTNAMALVKTELLNLYSAAKLSFNATESYRVMSGVFGCENPDEASELSSTTFNPTPVEILLSLKKVKDEVESEFSSSAPLDSLANKDKIKIDPKSSPVVTINPERYNFKLGNSGESLDSGLMSIFNSIKDLGYVSDATDINDYKTKLAQKDSSLMNKLNGISGDKIAYCNKVGATSSKTSTSYKFEMFPVNLNCRYLFGDDSSDSLLGDSYNQLFNPSSTLIPSEDEFKNNKKKLAKRFYTAAAFVAAQKSIHTDSSTKVVKSGCHLKSGQKLIGRLMASYPLKFVEESGSYVLKSQQYNHLHPESLFAISSYNKYFANDFLAVWGQVTPNVDDGINASDLKKQGILLPLNNMPATDKVLDKTFNGNSLNINFRIRSVGGTCDIYC